MFLKLELKLVQDTAVEERRINRKHYKLVLKAIKIIPMLLAFCDLTNTLLYLLGFNIEAFSFIGGISFLTLAFLYLISYVFQFCIYHRMFLHYILINNIIGTLEYTVGIPVSDQAFFYCWAVISGLFLFAILYLKKKSDAAAYKEIIS